uniref:Putative secreted protein n=1 Tax=Ixodes ricinus TaxID=34613 RepID=A0A6B0U723_IXORI
MAHWLSLLLLITNHFSHLARNLARYRAMAAGTVPYDVTCKACITSHACYQSGTGKLIKQSFVERVQIGFHIKERVVFPVH